MDQTLLSLVLELIYQLLAVVALALPVACVSWTFTKEEIFKELREWLCKKLKNRAGWICEKITYLITCHYCFSHWITALILIAYPVKLAAENWFGYITAGFAIVWVANFYLTMFNILRVFLKLLRAKADRAELMKKRLEKTT